MSVAAQGIHLKANNIVQYTGLVSLCTMFVAPFAVQTRYDLLPLYQSEWLAFVLGLCAVAAYLCKAYRQENLELPRIALLPLGLLAFVMAQQLLLPGVIREYGLLGMVYFAWAAILMILAHNLRNSDYFERLVRFLAYALVIGGVLVGCLEIWSLLVRHVYGNWGGQFQPNIYGDYMFLSVVSWLYLWLKTGGTHHWHGNLLALGAVIIVAGLGITPSRTVLLYWLMLAVLSGIGAFREKRGLLKPLFFLMAGYALMQFAWVDFITPEAVQIQEALPMQSSIDRVVHPAVGQSVRWHLWLSAWDLFLQSPWLGQGFGRFDWAYFNAGYSMPGILNYHEHAHNLLLQFLAELGVFPVLMLGFFLTVWLRDLLKTPCSLENGWLLASLSVLGLHSLLEYPLWYLHFLGIAAVLLGMGEQKAYAMKTTKLLTGLTGGAVLLLIGLSINHRLNYFRLENVVNDLKNPGKQSSFPKSVSALKSVAEDSPILAPYVAYLFASMGEDKDREVSEHMLAIGGRAIRFIPNPITICKHIVRLAMAGRHDESVDLLGKFLKAFPARINDIDDEIKTYPPAIRQKAAYLLEIINLRQKQ